MRVLATNRLQETADCLRTLGHPIRLRMIQLMLHTRYAVGELARACDIPSHVASEHLRRMKDRGLLTRQRQGHRIYYEVSRSHVESIVDCLRTGQAD